ncbi:putative heme utilization radical SAM enzyme HutW [Desulfosarcina ovata subsp. sediminis]|uniref:Putative heme utilization radical SAM enzyme HutW n=1 Tax=Desulfosarcina ovata subsp. sediminis TaxID=885957 RepID=A0A5K7ZIH9_9BACT|nr:heme anaerobic degradation radical SAM methyltransferase ChuW/HutW [Desulfosarcina ovata]BBO81932.1 putative heme utilization radical SAM enzyme HutW [Desulfosarcina ovata subsp. sediminis]
MDWTPEAKRAIEKVPPFVRKMAAKAVEAYAKDKGMGTVTLEIVQQAKEKMMGRFSRNEDSATDSLSGFNVGMNRRQTMHLTDHRSFLANETDDPLHEAFDRKLAVHAMPRNKTLPPEHLHRYWAEVMSEEHVGQPMRTIYIHIPFCRSHCLFCGFYQNAYQPRKARQYVDALLEEMAGTAQEPFAKRAPFQAVYFGGGTPTALSASDIYRLVDGVKTFFPLANDCELTLEGRFHDFGEDKIEAALTAGVNRFSLGVQTFDTVVRKSLGRREPEEKLIHMLTHLRDQGAAAIIIDLIYGLPGQTMDIWEKDLKTYLDLEIDGCDLYQLNIFAGGPLESAVRNQTLPRPATLREQADFYQCGVDRLSAAHQRQLSITHWARNTRERSLYNALSRGRSECITLGAGAGGWLGKHMFFLEGDLNAYIQRVQTGKKPLVMGYGGDQHHLLLRDIACQIELGYCDMKSLSARHGMDLFAMTGHVVDQWKKVGLIRMDDGVLHLTRAGAFWAVNLSQILIDLVQMQNANAGLT